MSEIKLYHDFFLRLNRKTVILASCGEMRLESIHKQHGPVTRSQIKSDLQEGPESIFKRPESVQKAAEDKPLVKICRVKNIKDAERSFL